MTNPISRRLDRLETEIQKTTGDLDRGWRPGDPVFKLIDNLRDPDNVERWKRAEQFSRENPNGLIIHHIINWEHYIEAGTNVQVGEAYASERSSLLSEMIKRIDAERAAVVERARA